MTAPALTVEDVDALLVDTLDLARATLGIDNAPAADPATSLAARILALHDHMASGGPRPAAWPIP